MERTFLNYCLHDVLCLYEDDWWLLFVSEPLKALSALFADSSKPSLDMWNLVTCSVCVRVQVLVCVYVRWRA